MHNTDTEICKPERRAWRKHMDKNKQRKRRNLVHKRFG